LLIFLVAAIVAVAPIAVTYIRDPFAFNNRVSEISVFRDVRDQGSLAPLTQNIGDVLKFFHQTGDLQGKHNLPGEPMTDPITGLLFAVGIGYAILGWRDQRRVLLLIWLVLGLAGSFLSSHHESPQSYRALTALPAVILMAADVLERIGRAIYRGLQDEEGLAIAYPLLPVWAASGTIVLALLCATLWESNVYFGRQAASIDVIRGFNPTENQVARETLAALQNGDEVYLSPSFSSYSPLRFLVYGTIKARTGKNTLDDEPYKVVLPEVNLPFPDHKHNVLMLLDSQYGPLRDYITSLYPKARIELVSLTDGSPLYIRVKVPQSQTAQLQGLVQHVTYSDGRTEQRTVSKVEVNDAQITEATWEGAIRFEHGGQYELHGENGLQVFIDDQPYNGKHYLGRGLYRLRLTWKSGSGNPKLILQMNDTEPQPVPADVLFRITGTARGLLGTYWPNMNWEGEPLFHQVTPFLLLAWPDEQPIVPNGEFSARYTGLLHISEPGSYMFRVQADDGARLTLDGNTLAEGMTAGQPNEFDTNVELQVGDHPIQIDYFQQGGGSGLRLFWSFNGSPLTPIPPTALIPAKP
jgi:hypothetical protein